MWWRRWFQLYRARCCQSWFDIKISYNLQHLYNLIEYQHKYIAASIFLHLFVFFFLHKVWEGAAPPMRKLFAQMYAACACATKATAVRRTTKMLDTHSDSWFMPPAGLYRTYIQLYIALRKFADRK